MIYTEHFDVIVIGGGHAGTEACLAAARMGCSTLLLTHNIETLGQMSCNPAIGGIGKSHLVREIDALDGVMARAADLAGIQFRVLNASKGPAVRATRAQADRVLYKAAIRFFLENQPNLKIFQQPVDDLIVENNTVVGVVSNTGTRFFAKSVVLAAGTFLGGKIHIGLENHPGGRAGDPPSTVLAERLRALPLNVARLKTGTPPRIDSRTIDFSKLEAQHSDTPLPVMSFLGKRADHPDQVACYIAHTNEKTHAIIQKNLDRSPMYTGVIEGIGPRYCPSIEDKVNRFAEKKSHQVFLEPEGLKTHEIYPNGISTSLPLDVQIEIVHSIVGMEAAHITRPGYAIEYDFFDPRDLKHSLENKHIKNIFFAGQINGTTGYEEAAAQGLLAGINAALKAQEKEPWFPRRDQAYIGVMVDDLVTRGAQEPYRMFTSRAEYRLLLREDNADARLTEIGKNLGLVCDARWKLFNEKNESILNEQHRLQTTWIQAGSVEAEKIQPLLGGPISHEYSLMDLLRRPGITYKDIASLKGAGVANQQAVEQIETEAKYAGYIERQQEDISRLHRAENLRIPSDLDYSTINGLSHEVKQKLTKAQPETIGQASRVPGVTAAAVSLLLILLRKKEMPRQKTAQ